MGRNPALLVIDFVEAYLAADSPLYAGVESTRDAALRLLQSARERHMPIVHTFVELSPAAETGASSFAKCPRCAVSNAVSTRNGALSRKVWNPCPVRRSSANNMRAHSSAPRWWSKNRRAY
jgi:nicotinamidase-related amidase